MLAVVQDIMKRRELLTILVWRNLKIRYKNSSLGFFWSLLAPLFMILIYAVFLRVLKVPIDLESLVTGIIAWQFLAMCMGDALYAVVGNANLVTKSSFPRILLPFSMSLANLINFLLSGVVLLVYLLVVRAEFGNVLWLPLIILSQLALCLGVSLLLSASNVFFRDTVHIQSMIALAWFFLTPVIYPLEFVTRDSGFPEWVTTLFFANPMTGLISGYRIVLLSNASPGAGLLALSIIVAWAVLLLGTWVFQRVQDRFGDEL